MNHSFIRLFLVLMATLTSTGAGASGVVTVNGKLISITDKAFIVRTELATYSIKKSAVERKLAESIDRPEIPVKLTVPFDALDRIKPLRQ